MASPASLSMEVSQDSLHSKVFTSWPLDVALLWAGAAVGIQTSGAVTLGKHARHLSLIALLAHAQWVGPRWQFAPLYVSICLVFLVDCFITELFWRRALSTLCLFLVAASALANYVLPMPTWPAGRGPYRVGKTVRYWIDSSRASWFHGSFSQEERRRLVVDIWYPTNIRLEQLRSFRPSSIITPSSIEAICEEFKVPSLFMQHLSRSILQVSVDAPVHQAARDHGGWPVVLFSHSLAGCRMQNCSLFQDLASHGYVVVAMDHPHDAAITEYPDGSTPSDFRFFTSTADMQLTPAQLHDFRCRCLQDRVDDMIFVHKRIGELAHERNGPFQGLLNMENVATLGHSFGGGTAVTFCQQVDVKCGIVLDPFLWVNGRENLLKGSPVPLLCPKSPEMLGDRDGFCCVNTGLIQLLCGRSPSSWIVTLPEFGHFDFSDAIFVCPPVLRMLSSLKGLLNIPMNKCLKSHHFIADMCLAFLGEHCPLPATSTCKFDVSKQCSQSVKAEWQSFNPGCNPRHQMCGLSLRLKTHGPQWTEKQLKLMRAMVERALREGRFDKDMVHCGGDIVQATSIIFSCHSPEAIREKLLDWAIPGAENAAFQVNRQSSPHQLT